MDRRDVLKTAGGIGAAAIAGGAGVTALSGSAAAEASLGTFDIPDPAVTMTDDGKIDSFTLDSVEVSGQYDGIDPVVGSVKMWVGVVPPTGDATVANAQTLKFETYQVADEGSLNEHAGQLTKSHGPIDVLAESSWEASDFEETEGGETKNTDVIFGCMFQLQDMDGNDITPGGQQSVTSQGTVTISVENEPETAGTGGNGEVSVGGENQENGGE